MIVLPKITKKYHIKLTIKGYWSKMLHVTVLCLVLTSLVQFRKFGPLPLKTSNLVVASKVNARKSSMLIVLANRAWQLHNNL